MNPPLAITACQVLTPLDVADAGALGDTWEAIRAGRRVERRNAVDDRHLDDDLKLDRSIRLALAVARSALSTGVGESKSRADMSLFCGTSKGPAGVMLESLARLRRGESLPAAHAKQIALGVGAMGTILGERLGLGAGHTSVAACSSGLHALHRAARALWHGECDRALVVAADASLHELFEASFARLGVLAPADAQGIRRCEPFGERGEGFFISEAAAAIVLARPNGASGFPDARQVIAWLEECWIGGDGTALVAVDESTDALRSGLRACMHPTDQPLAFVHAHATGTAHDAFEREAIRAICGTRTEVFSHKAWLGHSLGAAGLVGVALSAQCHARGQTLTGVPVEPGGQSLTIAQGFGGHMGVIRMGGGRGGISLAFDAIEVMIEPSNFEKV